MTQQGQVFKLASVTRNGHEQWAYRYRAGGRGSKRVQHGGFASASRTRRQRSSESSRSCGEGAGLGRMLTLAELVEQYLAQHEASPVTLEKLRWLLEHAEAAFGGYRLDESHPAGDRGLADDDPGRLPLRSNPGATAGARPRRRLGHARRQPGQAGSREPAAAAHREATIRILGRTRRRRQAARSEARPDGDLRCGHRHASRRVGRARAARHRS